MKASNATKNRIGDEIEKLFPRKFHIHPKREFFAEIGIQQKRWGQILRDEKPATIAELKKVSKHFKIPLSMLIPEANK